MQITCNISVHFLISKFWSNVMIIIKIEMQATKREEICLIVSMNKI